MCKPIRRSVAPLIGLFGLLAAGCGTGGAAAAGSGETSQSSGSAPAATKWTQEKVSALFLDAAGAGLTGGKSHTVPQGTIDKIILCVPLNPLNKCRPCRSKRLIPRPARRGGPRHDAPSAACRTSEASRTRAPPDWTATASGAQAKETSTPSIAIRAPSITIPAFDVPARRSPEIVCGGASSRVAVLRNTIPSEPVVQASVVSTTGSVSVPSVVRRPSTTSLASPSKTIRVPASAVKVAPWVTVDVPEILYGDPWGVSVRLPAIEAGSADWAEGGSMAGEVEGRDELSRRVQALDAHRPGRGHGEVRGPGVRLRVVGGGPSRHADGRGLAARCDPLESQRSGRDQDRAPADLAPARRRRRESRAHARQDVGPPGRDELTQLRDDVRVEERLEVRDARIEDLLDEAAPEELLETTPVERRVPGVLEEALDLVHRGPEEDLLLLVEAAVEVPGEQDPLAVRRAVVEEVVVPVVEDDAVLRGCQHRVDREVGGPLLHVHDLLDGRGELRRRRRARVEPEGQIDDVAPVGRVLVRVLLVLRPVRAEGLSAVVQVGAGMPRYRFPVSSPGNTRSRNCSSMVSTRRWYCAVT